MYFFDRRGAPRRPDSPHPRAKRVMFKLPAEVPEDKWTQAGPKKGKWRSFEDGGRTSWAYRKQFQASKREAIRLENYKGKNHMSRSQWRRHQRLRKAEREMTSREIGESSNIKVPPNVTNSTKPPVGRKLFPDENKSQKLQKEQVREEEMLTDDFESDGVSFVNMNCNVVSVLPYEYNQETEVTDNEEADAVEMAKHKPVCYYMLNSDAVEEQNALFERPHQGIQSHLKPLYIRSKLDR
jgi:hypothetical protein